MMEGKQDRQQTISRLAVCVIAAVVLYLAVEKFGEKIPQIAPYRPWLEKNKVQAIALIAAALFGGSLALLPEMQKKPPAPPEDCEEPVGGYERVREG